MILFYLTLISLAVLILGLLAVGIFGSVPREEP